MNTSQAHHTGVIVNEHSVSFWLWAPFAKAVSIVGDFNSWQETATPLEHKHDGYWYVDVAGAEPGQQYKYCLTTQDNTVIKKNDPRALQLTATGDNAIIVDPDFDWQADNFTLGPVNQQVIYELHIGTFNRPDPSTSGTFDTAIEKLDYLATLGVTAIELMPCSENWMDRWWGYTPDYPYAVESAYGGRHAMMRFVREAHKRGIGIILDVVYNHLSPDPGLDIWQFDGWQENNRGGIYFYNDWRAVTPWGDTRLDYGRPEVRDYIVENARMWLRDCHVDGLRVDSTHYIRNAQGRDNDASTDIHDGWAVLQAITAAAAKERPHSLLIAEDTASNSSVTTHAPEGLGFAAQWETPLPFVLRELLSTTDDASRSFTDLCTSMEKTYNGNPFSKVIYSESHDADANGRARLNEEISPGDSGNLYARRRSGLAAALVLTAPGIPMLFQGQEFMEKGCFSNWRALDWEQPAHHSGIVQLYKDLVALRRNTRQQTAGLQGKTIHFFARDEDAKVLAYARSDKGGARDTTFIVCNMSNQSLTDYKLNFPNDGIWHVRLNSDWQGYGHDFNGTEADSVTVHDSNATIAIGPYSFLIFSQE